MAPSQQREGARAAQKWRPCRAATRARDMQQLWVAGTAGCSLPGLEPPRCQAILDCLVQITSRESPDCSEVSVQGRTRLKWLNTSTHAAAATPQGPSVLWFNKARDARARAQHTPAHVCTLTRLTPLPSAQPPRVLRSPHVPRVPPRLALATLPRSPASAWSLSSRSGCRCPHRAPHLSCPCLQGGGNCPLPLRSHRV